MVKVRERKKPTHALPVSLCGSRRREGRGMTVSDLFYRPQGQPKPLRGSSTLAREEKRTTAQKQEADAKAEAKQRDGFKCRWPEPHKCRGPLEGAHIVDKSLGGANVAENIVTVCRWIHRAGPESIHGKQLRVDTETPAGANAGLSFWRRDARVDLLGQPTYHMVALETAPFVLERGL
jgi:hypothetical protein